MIRAYWGRKPPFESDIPDNYPAKTVLEQHCRQLLAELGSGWRITLAVRPARRRNDDRWTMSVGFITASGRHLHRTWRVPPYAEGVERRFRAAIEEIRRDALTRFGMLPARPLAADVADELHAWVLAQGGQVDADGWISLTDQASWKAFLELAAAVGVQYIADVRKT